VLDDGAYDAEQRDDEEQGADGDEQDGSNAQQVRVGGIVPHARQHVEVLVDQHPGTDRRHCQPT